MLTTKLALLALALVMPATVPSDDEGQGTAQPGANINDLQMGTYLLGPNFDASAMLGKVLVVEIGGG